jgi:hypothetical protein
MNRLTWPAVALIGVLAGVAVALATLADWDTTAILGVLGVLAGIGGGAAVAGGVAGKVEDVHDATTAQNATLADQDKTLATIARRVDGELDKRIVDAMEDAAETGAARAIAALRSNGVIH